MTVQTCRAHDCNNIIVYIIDSGGQKKFCSDVCRDRYHNRKRHKDEIEVREKCSFGLEKIDTRCSGNYMSIGGHKYSQSLKGKRRTTQE